MGRSPAWFYASNGRQSGPVGEDALRQLAAGGQLAATDLVWSEGMAEWTPAGRVPGLLPQQTAAATPPPLPPQSVGYFVPPPPDPFVASPADQNLKWLVPVGRSGWAIAAGYLGLFSFVIFPAPIALIVSIVAIRDIKKHPGRGGMGRAVFGLVTGALFTIAFAITMIALVTAK